MEEKHQLLNLDEISSYDNLLLFARAVVDGYFSGRHRAVNYGNSSQFKDYKAYQTGDDPAKIDWKLYGKSKKLFNRRFDNETDMTVYLMVDVSASMNYGEKQKKDLLTSKVAAALSYLIINQSDKVSLILFDKKVRKFIPPGGTRTQLHNIISSLEEEESVSGTDLCKSLNQCHGLLKKRGKLIIISDFWEAGQELFESLSRFVHRNFEILLMQVFDKNEMELPQYDNVRFIDMENGEELQVEPNEIRAQYTKNLKSTLDNIEQESLARKISYQLINTDQAYLEAIEAYLGFKKDGRL